MTDALYLDDSTTREFEATVDRTLDDRVVLDRTHFYPEGGGQPNDTGRFVDGDREWRVTNVQKTDTIYHAVDGDPPAEGTTLAGELDWGRRFAHMRYHTAQHLLSAVLLSEYDAQTTGNQLYADRARIDCEYERFTESDFEHIEDRVNDLVADERTVRWYEMDRETAEAKLDPERTRIHLLPESITDVRIVEIEGVDRTACAGTHVRNTGEIGTFEVTGRETKGSDEERLSFVLR